MPNKKNSVRDILKQLEEKVQYDCCPISFQKTIDREINKATEAIHKHYMDMIPEKKLKLPHNAYRDILIQYADTRTREGFNQCRAELIKRLK